MRYDGILLDCESVESKLSRTIFLSLALLNFLARVTILRDCSQSKIL